MKKKHKEISIIHYAIDKENFCLKVAEELSEFCVEAVHMIRKGVTKELIEEMGDLYVQLKKVEYLLNEDQLLDLKKRKKEKMKSYVDKFESKYCIESK